MIENAAMLNHHASAATLLISVVDNVVIRIDLARGSYRVGAAAAFPDYATVSGDSNAVTEVWKTSLRFSSITDVLAARTSR